jgi:hypothetical protein
MQVFVDGEERKTHPLLYEPVELKNIGSGTQSSILSKLNEQRLGHMVSARLIPAPQEPPMRFPATLQNLQQYPGRFSVAKNNEQSYFWIEITLKAEGMCPTLVKAAISLVFSSVSVDQLTR